VFGTECDDAIDQRSSNEREYRVAQQEDSTPQNVYDSLARQLTEHQRVLLRQPQTAWLTYRESACRFAASGGKGGASYGQGLSIWHAK
jgi:uncharacterized protein YecT (DUF1311 family)